MSPHLPQSADLKATTDLKVASELQVANNLRVVLSGPHSNKIFYCSLALLAATILVYPIAQANPLFHIFLHRLPFLPMIAIVSAGVALSIAALCDTNADWLHFLWQPKKCTAYELLAILESLGRNQQIIQLLGTVCGALILSSLESFFVDLYVMGGLSTTILYALLGALLFPLSAVPGLWLSRSVKVARIQQPQTRWRPRVMTAMKLSLRSFFVSRYPYLSAYLGFLFLTLFISFHPAGLGCGISGWFQAALRDASIGNNAFTPNTLNSQNPLVYFAICSCVMGALLTAFSRLAVRLSASYQLFANRVIINKDNLLEAIVETANVKASHITLPEAHPQLNNIGSILLWVIFCYVVMFSLVAFCPPPLGTTINLWLAASVRDSVRLGLADHNNLRLFLASVVAGWACIPMAVMSCSLLPNKKAKSLLVSSQGVLCPDSASSLIGQSPLKLWCDLKKVSVSNADKPEKQVLKLAFKSGGTLKLKTSEFQVEHVAELLSLADEYAGSCKFEPVAVDLRAKLSDDSKRAASVTDIHKFASTIFTPRKGGDRLKDGDYRIVRKLAGKPLSAVYLARDKSENHVVIKEFVLPTCVQQCERIDLSFEREHQLLRSLNHERIAKVIETFEEKGAKYIAIEHIRGQDLRSLVSRRGARNEKVVLRWALEIAELMHYLHQQPIPILHRDLSPDNLMEDEDGALKLIDFGAAHQFMEGVTGTLIGKQCYIAPEQLRGNPTIQSDIYSFGCTLQFLLTGRDPEALRQSDPQSRGVDVIPQLRNVIVRCTEFEQSDRYQSFSQILQDLNKGSLAQYRGRLIT